jgi:hypothetical protein
MSVCDLLAYLVGWNELVLHRHAQLRDGKRIEDIAFPPKVSRGTLSVHWRSAFMRTMLSWSMDDLLQRLEQAKDRLLALIDAHDDAQLYGQPWYKHYTMGAIQFNTASPYANARTRLRAGARPCSAATGRLARLHQYAQKIFQADSGFKRNQLKDHHADHRPRPDESHRGD